MTKSKTNVRKEAYRKKQEEQGKKIMNIIFAVLLVLAIVFAAYSVWLVS